MFRAVLATGVSADGFVHRYADVSGLTRLGHRIGTLCCGTGSGESGGSGLGGSISHLGLLRSSASSFRPFRLQTHGLTPACSVHRELIVSPQDIFYSAVSDLMPSYSSCLPVYIARSRHFDVAFIANKCSELRKRNVPMQVGLPALLASGFSALTLFSSVPLLRARRCTCPREGVPRRGSVSSTVDAAIPVPGH